MGTPNPATRALQRLLRPVRRWTAARERAAAGRELDALRLRDPVVLILVSGALHVTALALARVPSSVPVILVLNGLDDWEEAWARRRLSASAFICLRSPCRHGDVIDLLIDHVGSNFGILDYDCFVLNPAWFGRLAEIGERTAMNGCFPFSVAGPGLRLPHTFYLFFNRAVVKGLKDRYGVGASDLTWDRFPEAVRGRLATLGFGPGVVPEPDRPYFDTLRTLMLLAEADGMPCAVVGDLETDAGPSEEMYHVGGISLRNVVFNLWLYRGAYFWRRSLQRSGDAALQEHYRSRFGDIDPESLPREYPEFAAQVDPLLLRYFDRLIELGPERR